jgi:hypothetical protein
LLVGEWHARLASIRETFSISVDRVRDPPSFCAVVELVAKISLGLLKWLATLAPALDFAIDELVAGRAVERLLDVVALVIAKLVPA